MSLPIGCTPTLTGKDAARFLKRTKANEHKRASKKEVLAAINVFVKLLPNIRVLK